MYHYRHWLNELYKKMIRWQQRSTHLTASDNAVAPGVGKTLRTFFSNGIGRANALASFWVTIVAQMGTVTSFTRERESKDESEMLNALFVLSIFHTTFKDPCGGGCTYFIIYTIVQYLSEKCCVNKCCVSLSNFKILVLFVFLLNFKKERTSVTKSCLNCLLPRYNKV